MMVKDLDQPGVEEQQDLDRTELNLCVLSLWGTPDVVWEDWESENNLPCLKWPESIADLYLWECASRHSPKTFVTK